MANNTKVTAEPGKLELFITREFEAPRQMVFEAHIDPDVYMQWVGPKDLTMSIEKWEPYNGGSYAFTHVRGDHKYKFFGVYHDITAPERIIGTFEFDGLPETGHVILGTTKFEELDGGRCRLVHQSVFQSVADRDGMIQSGMEGGVTEGYEKLDALLAKSDGKNVFTA